MAYDIGILALPDPNVPGGTFVVTEVPPPAAPPATTFTCRVTDGSGNLLVTVTSTTAPASSTPVSISAPVGASLHASLTWTGNLGLPLTASLELPGGSAASLSGIRVSFEWLALGDCLLAAGQQQEPPTSYQADFGASPNAYFLAQYPWISLPSFMTPQPEQVPDNFNSLLEPNFSALFCTTLFGSASLATIPLPVPADAGLVSCTFLLMNVIADSRTSLQQWMTVTFAFDVGSPVVAPIGGALVSTPIPWTPALASTRIPDGARTVTVTAALAPVALDGEPAVPPGSVVAMDNFRIDFIPLPPAVPAATVLWADGNDAVFANAVTGVVNGTVPLQVGTLTAPPAVAESIAFCGEGGTQQSFLHAYSTLSNEDLWAPGIQINGSVDSTPALSKRAMYVGASNGFLFGYDLTTLEQPKALWPPFCFTASSVTVVGTILSADETQVYLVTSAGVFGVSVAGSAPSLLWSAQTGISFAGALPAFDGKRIYAVSGRDLYAFDVTAPPVNAVLPITWRTPNNANWSAPTVTLGAFVLAGDAAGVLHALNLLTGATVGTIAAPGTNPGPITAVAAFGNVAVFAANGAGKLFAYTLTSGIQWQPTLGWNATLQGSPAAATIDDGIVYVAGTDGMLHAFDFGTGEPLWKRAANGNATASAVFVTKPLDRSTFFTQSQAIRTNGLGIPLATKYDKVCWLCSHNAYSAIATGWCLFPQQIGSIPYQLQNCGVRALMLDVWGQTINGQLEVVYKHESLGKPWLWGTSWQLLSDSLKEIKTWLDQNPDEVLTIILEQRVGRGAVAETELYKAFRAAALMPPVGGTTQNYVYWADRNNVAQNSQPAWDNNQPPGHGFPALQWMVDSGHRLAVFSDRNSSADPTAVGWQPPSDDGFAWLYKYAVENHFDYRCIRSPGIRRDQSYELDNPNVPLFVMNFFQNVAELPGGYVPMAVLGGLPLLYSFRQRRLLLAAAATLTVATLLPVLYTHAYGTIMDAARVAYDASKTVNRLPNFLAINFVEYGIPGWGPREAVEQINLLLPHNTRP